MNYFVIGNLNIFHIYLKLIDLLFIMFIALIPLNMLNNDGKCTHVIYYIVWILQF